MLKIPWTEKKSNEEVFQEAGQSKPNTAHQGLRGQRALAAHGRQSRVSSSHNAKLRTQDILP